MWAEQEIEKMAKLDAMPFPMLTDPVGEIGKMYGVFDEEIKLDLRGTFIIDPDGKIVAYEILTPAAGRNLNESIRQIQAFQLIREKDGCEATPMGWMPGKPVLKPNPDLVGNVWKEWTPSE